MPKKLTRHGNSLALIIDKPLLEVLKITEKTDLEISIQNNRLIIQPVQTITEYSDQKIMKMAKEFMDKYHEVFKKLAE